MTPEQMVEAYATGEEVVLKYESMAKIDRRYRIVGLFPVGQEQKTGCFLQHGAERPLLWWPPEILYVDDPPILLDSFELE